MSQGLLTTQIAAKKFFSTGKLAVWQVDTSQLLSITSSQLGWDRYNIAPNDWTLVPNQDAVIGIIGARHSRVSFPGTGTTAQASGLIDLRALGWNSEGSINHSFSYATQQAASTVNTTQVVMAVAYSAQKWGDDVGVGYQTIENVLSMEDASTHILQHYASTAAGVAVGTEFQFLSIRLRRLYTDTRDTYQSDFFLFGFELIFTPTT